VGEDLAEEHQNRRITIDNELLNIEYSNPYVDQLAHVVKCLQEKRQPEVGLAEALKNIEHLETIK
jgi:predicted dehydrogenase